jgi:hypothetical protein
MKQIFNFLVCIVCIGVVMAWSADTTLAADKADYSGKYSLRFGKPVSGNDADLVLDVVENEDSIEITRVEQGRKTTNRYPLNGSDGGCTSPSGISGRCKAQLKGKFLLVESVVAIRPQPTASPVRVHTKERWQLSSDSKTLTIKSYVDFPDFPAGISAAVNASGTEQYTRVENQ